MEQLFTMKRLEDFVPAGHPGPAPADDQWSAGAARRHPFRHVRLQCQRRSPQRCAGEIAAGRVLQVFYSVRRN